MTRLSYILALAALPACLGVGGGATITGFQSSPPGVPNLELEDLVVELVWDYAPTQYLQVVNVPNSEQLIAITKDGDIRLFASTATTADEFTPLLSMFGDVYAYMDHGLLSIALHPQWANGVTKAFVYYTGEIKDVQDLPNYTTVSPIRPWGAGYTGFYAWYDQCPSLGEENNDGKICEHPSYIDRLDIDLVGMKATKELTLIKLACGSTQNHGGGFLQFLPNGDLAVSVGDGSSADELDPGHPTNDGCYVPGMGDDQGQFRPQRDEFLNGKVVGIPAANVDSTAQLGDADVYFLAKGVRNPFRMFYDKERDALFVGDVGAGDGATTERIFMAHNVTLAGRPKENFGWPCVEGIRYAPNAGYSLFDSGSEQGRLWFLANNGLHTCDPVDQAALNMVGPGVSMFTGPQPLSTTVPDPMWQAPMFEYRLQTLDSKFPLECGGTGAAITTLYKPEGTQVPVMFQGRLLMSDYGKKCLFLFQANPDGSPDFTAEPDLIATNIAALNAFQAQDGCLYFVDSANGRLLRFRSQAAICTGGGFASTPTTTVAGATLAPFVPPTDIPFVTASTIVNGRCSTNNPTDEFVWTEQPDGSLTGTLDLNALSVQTAKGTLRTRAFNAAVPGPLMYMEPCKNYKLTLVNDLSAWPNVKSTEMNVQGDPMITNLHLHGLHISGDTPGDYPFVTVNPGFTNEYSYMIPCDHQSGTFWYHPHHHGSVALQTDAGAAGMLIVKAGAPELEDTPLEYQRMPEVHLTMQEINPTDSTISAAKSLDVLFTTDITDNFYLVNGCEAYTFEITAGQWTRLRMLRVGNTYNAFVDIAAAAGAAECDVALLAKDGVTLSDVPRALPDLRLFMSLSSRLDIAVRCPFGGVSHTFTLTHIADFTTGGAIPMQLATMTVAANTTAVDPDLPAWQPKRPAYLKDTMDIAATGLTSRTMDIRETLNGITFTGPDTIAFEIELGGKCEEWIITGSYMHPYHVHVNHMQLNNMDDSNQWTDVPGWNVAGDWVDTVSVPGDATVRLCPDRFIGTMISHCHIAVHSDMGLISVMKITGDGDTADSSPLVSNWGEFPINNSTYAGTVPMLGHILLPNNAVNGKYFMAGNVSKPPEVNFEPAIEIRSDFTVAQIITGHKLVYSFDVYLPGVYSVIYSVASGGGKIDATGAAMPVPLQISLHAGDVPCPSAPGAVGAEGVLKLTDVTTGNYDKYKDFAGTTINLLEGMGQEYTLCFEQAEYVVLGSICIGNGCGAAAVVSPPSRKALSKRMKILSWLGHQN